MLDAETDDFGWNTAADIAAAVAAGRRTAENVVAAALARIRARDPLLNAFTTVIEERAVARARTLDEARARRDALRPLAGVSSARSTWASTPTISPARTCTTGRR